MKQQKNAHCHRWTSFVILLVCLLLLFGEQISDASGKFTLHSTKRHVSDILRQITSEQISENHFYKPDTLCEGQTNLNITYSLERSLGSRSIHSANIADFSKQLNQVRLKLLKSGQLTNNSFSILAENYINLTERGNNAYFKDISQRPWIKTVILHASNTTYSPVTPGPITHGISLIRDKLFDYYLDSGACADALKGHEDVMVKFTIPCKMSANYDITLKPLSMENSSYPRSISNKFSNNFVHLVPDAVIGAYGQIHAADVMLIPHTCPKGVQPRSRVSRHYHDYPLLPEVVTIATFWSAEVYHFSIESLPRLVTLLPFLRDNPGIHIHVRNRTRSWVIRAFQTLGLDPTRLVDGGVRARIAYVPQGYGCGTDMNVYNIQCLATLYQEYINLDLHSNRSRKAIVLLRRTETRRLRQHAQIARLLRQTAQSVRMDFVVLSAETFGRYNDTLRLLQRTALLVGAHGAGLSNAIYLKPPAVVVEIVCAVKRFAYLYPVLSQILGHRYYGLRARSGCDGGLNVNMKLFIDTLRYIRDGILQ